MPANAPAWSPGVTREKALRGVAVANGQNCVTAEQLLAESRHRHFSVHCHVGALKTFVNSEAEHEWIPCCQTALHRYQVLAQSKVLYRSMPQRRRVARGRRFSLKCRDVIGPHGFGAHTLCG